MASRMLDPTWALNKVVTWIGGSFAPAGTSTPTAQLGLGWSVTTVAAGNYLITFQDTWPALLAVTATVQSPAAVGVFAQVGTYDPVAKTLAIRTVDGSGAITGLATNANARVNFAVQFTNSSVTPQ